MRHSERDLAQDLERSERRYASNNPVSLEHFNTALKTMPGGNTRTSVFFPPFPLMMVRGEASFVWDADHHRYLDFLGEYSAAIYGHSNALIRDAIEAALQNGINLSGQNPLENVLSQLLCNRFDSMDLVRFTNSGTEANLMSLALAAEHTGRKKILVFEGAYHGGPLTFIDGASPVNMPFDFVVAQYNDEEGTTELMQRHRADLAAVLVEPMMGAGGCIPADHQFLSRLREFTRDNGSLLIFDEVVTSRLSGGGLQGQTGITPDLSTVGKYIGGGMPIGAFGGRADLMSRFDPRQENALSHSGTYNANVITLAASITGLSKIYTPAAADALSRRGDAFRERLNGLCRSLDLPLQFTGAGSVMNLHIASHSIKNYADAAAGSNIMRKILFFDLLDQGIYIAQRGLIALSLTIDEEAFEKFYQVFANVIESRSEQIKATAQR